jgi:hypothetical protein
VNVVVECSDEHVFMAIPGGDGIAAGQIGRSPLWPVCQKTVRSVGGVRGGGVGGGGYGAPWRGRK